MGEIEASDAYIHHNSSNIVEENPSERCGAEIRRSKKMANGPNIPAGMANKRSRGFPSGGNQEDSADRDRFCGEQEDGVGVERDLSVAFRNSEKVNSQIRLLRSVSTPIGAVESMLSAACKSSSKLSVVEVSAEEIGHRIESGGEKQVQIETLPRVPMPAATRTKVCKTKKSYNISICRANSENLRVIAKDCCPPYGVMSIVGRRDEMEDTVAAVPSFCCSPNKGSGSESVSFSALHFFAVYDGHGGSQASVFCRERLHEALAEELRTLPSSRFDDCRRDLDEWKRAMTNCFIKIDIEVGGACPSGTCSFDDSNSSNYAPCCRDPVAPDNVGSTAVVAVVTPSQIIVASCGDSRAVLSRGGKAIPFSNDHKPEREDELVRIQAAGGRVIYWNGYRVGGFLAMSRAIGDFLYLDCFRQ
uniref:protein-serine/threonine phosphatase n=1 Tax=Araucaria cunninghamii TaxID=56994 RepID=A0A0D6QXJ5_ARACU